ncbi:MAG TPA: calcium-binding protein, partial [Actinomycetota bacterium]|nr:calcium-binding protein [Actinomycetota bacterium]
VDTVGDGSECPGGFYMATSQTDPFVLDPNNDLVFAVFVTPPPLPATASATCKGEQATQVGTEGNDEVTGTPGRDVIAALGGSDEISGLAGKDLICGGNGKDTLRGGKGKDKLYGQKGKDKLVGGGGKDRCVGGKKDDTAKKCEVEKSI